MIYVTIDSLLDWLLENKKYLVLHKVSYGKNNTVV